MCKLIWNFKVFAYSTNHYTPIIDLDHFSSLPRRNASHIDQGLTPKGSKLLPYLGSALNQISLRSTEYFHYWVANINSTNHLTLEWTNTIDKFWLISWLKILKGNKSSFFVHWYHVIIIIMIRKRRRHFFGCQIIPHHSAPKM